MKLYLMILAGAFLVPVYIGCAAGIVAQTYSGNVGWPVVGIIVMLAGIFWPERKAKEPTQ